jgi:phosphatidylserine/phosphatidylglycerophosphate/cardiolipin synthase-like enzyme
MKPDLGIRRKTGVPDEGPEPIHGRNVSIRWAGPRLGPGVAVVLLVGLFIIFRLVPIPTPSEPEGEPSGSRSQAIQVYFTIPGPAAPGGQVAAPEAVLIDALDRAQRSIDVAVYALNLEQVADALRRAEARGVRVRLVTESDNASEPEVQALAGAGIPIREDQRPGLMHHKFVVIDGAEVWTGSMNLTVGSAFHDDNNLVRIASPEVAMDFTREFEEMFVEDRFGALSLRDTPRIRSSVGGVPVEVLFSPDDGVADRIMGLIDGAQVSLEFAAFSFTSDSIADRILVAAARGVNVRGVIETSQAGGAGSEYENLGGAGVDVRLDGNPFNMHHKFLIIDGQTVVTGSYNFTFSAEEHNDENLLVIHDRQIAELFGNEFARIFDVAGDAP